MPRVYVSIGSNIDREANVRAALKQLRMRFGELIVSPVYESEAVGFAGDSFYNLVVGFDTECSLAEVTSVLRAIEAQQGRVRGEQRFCDRTLDLDALLYGDKVDHKAPNDIPRHEIDRYAFVLRPLSDIAGNERHPETGERFVDMWTRLEKGSQHLWPVQLEF